MTNEKNIDNFEVQKLNTKKVLKESIGIYKSGFKTFIILSVIIFILTFGNSILDYIGTLFTPHTDIGVIISLITIAYTSAYIYVKYRIVMAIYVFSDRLCKDERISAKEAYVQTKGFFWRYIGVVFKYALIIALPYLAIYSLYYRFKENSVIKYTGIALLLIPLVYLHVKYCFVVISAILKKEKHQYFQISKLLVSGDFWPILFLVFISSLIFMLPFNIYTRVLFDYRTMGVLHKFIASSVNGFFYIFITPFGCIVTTVMYLTLKRNKNID